MKQIITIGIILIISISLIYICVNIATLNKKIKKQFSTIDEYFKKRWELMPNIIGIANGYIKYEKNNLKTITEILNADYNKFTEIEKIKKNIELSIKINDFLTYVEAYPEIEENSNYVKLKTILITYENEIKKNIKIYNELSEKYNKKIEKNPTKIIAKLFNFKKKEIFK